MKSTGTVKRALSGVMALLTVGAYALPAEIGSFLAVSNAVTASAAAKDIASGNVDASGLSYGDILRKGVVVVASGGPYVSRNGGTSFVHSGGDIMSFDAKVESLEYRSGKKEGYYLIISVYHGYLEDAYLTVDTENGTTSVRIGSVTVPESEYDVTYGTSAETAAAEFPTAPGEYYAFVTAKDTSTRYSGSKQSAAFTVEGEPEPPDYLKFTAEEDGSSVTFNYYQGTFQYSADAVEWTDLTHETAISLDEGDSVYFRGSGNDNLRLFSSGSNSHLKISGKAACSGNIMTLLDYEHPDEAQMGESCFDYMFSGCTGLTQAPELPAAALAENCYRYMFYGCTGLTAAPELPAAALAEFCYEGMFYGCTGLTEAPELPATALARYCYDEMFMNCTGLTKAPELPAMTLADGCYLQMFCGCTGLKETPAVLPAAALEPTCYKGMFKDCTGLTAAPDLPAAALADYCYSEMFYNCTSLTEAPELPAETLAVECYNMMFAFCSGLTNAPQLPAATLANSCYYSMFVSCTGLTEAPELPATTLAANCYYDMFGSCTGLEKAPELPATTLADSCYCSMFDCCIGLTEAPELPATTLANKCYYRMFNRCTGISLSETQTEEYKYAYRVPSAGEGTSAANALTEMFEGTGGTFSGTPGINTTYYMKKSAASSDAVDISGAAVNLDGENTVVSITIGEDTMTDLTEFDITYGTDDSHTAEAVPAEAGTYYAYVTAKDTNTSCTGTAKSAEFTVAPSAAITGAVTVTGLQKLLRFSYVSNYKGEAVCGVLIKRDAVAELLTEETASADKQLEGAEDFFRAEDTGKGITLRPYVEVENVRCYGEQVYYTFDGVDMAEGTAKITGAAVYNANTGKIDFTYAAFYEGEGTVTYGVLIKRGLEEGVKLTRALAAADYPLSSAEAVFRSQDKGAGITLRPYIEIDGERKYGEQVTYYLSELVG